jgi:fatty-acyl-CoA synthase
MTTKSFDWITHHTRTRPNKLASVDLGTNRRFTYIEMNDRCSRLATLLRDVHGVGFGDRIAVLARNNTNFFDVQFCCWKIGAIFCPLNWRLAIPELEFILGDSTPVLHTRAPHPCSTPVLHIVDAGFADAGVKLHADGLVPIVINWDVEGDYEQPLADAALLTGPADCTHDTPITMMYTSDTTGRPKGAIITRGMVLFNAINCVEFFMLSTSAVNLNFYRCFTLMASTPSPTRCVTSAVRTLSCATSIREPVSSSLVTKKLASPISWAFPPTTYS